MGESGQFGTGGTQDHNFIHATEVDPCRNEGPPRRPAQRPLVNGRMGKSGQFGTGGTKRDSFVHAKEVGPCGGRGPGGPD